MQSQGGPPDSRKPSRWLRRQFSAALLRLNSRSVVTKILKAYLGQDRWQQISDNWDPILVDSEPREALVDLTHILTDEGPLCLSQAEQQDIHHRFVLALRAHETSSKAASVAAPNFSWQDPHGPVPPTIPPPPQPSSSSASVATPPVRPEEVQVQVARPHFPVEPEAASPRNSSEPKSAVTFILGRKRLKRLD